MPTSNDWLRFAKCDLKVAHLIIQNDQLTLSTALFYAQQCAEKSLKAYLVHQGITPKKTICLIKLVRCCMRINPLFTAIRQDAIDVNPFSGKICYPSDTYIPPDPDTAHILIKKAENIYTFVENKIVSCC